MSFMLDLFKKDEKNLASTLNNINQSIERLTSEFTTLKDDLDRKLSGHQINRGKIDLSEFSELINKKVKEFISVYGNLNDQIELLKGVTIKFDQLITERLTAIDRTLDKYLPTARRIENQIQPEKTDNTGSSDISSNTGISAKQDAKKFGDEIPGQNRAIDFPTKNRDIASDLPNPEPTNFALPREITGPEGKKIKDLFEKYSSEEPVKDILKELNFEHLSNSKIRRVLYLYRQYYQVSNNNLARELEKILKSDFKVKFFHAQVGFNVSSAGGFDIVRFGEIFQLEQYEREKLKNLSGVSKASSEILFELCPQVRIDRELIFNGKIIISE